MKDARRVIARVVVASFALAAAVGIFTLLNPGEFSEAEAKVLLSTLVVGAESILALCYLAAAGGRWRAVAALGGAVSLVATVTALVMVWGEVDGNAWKWLGIAIVLAVAFAQASLLLPVADRSTVRPVLWLTLATTVLVASMACIAIVADGDVSGGFWRAFGVLAILNVLGTIVLMAIGLAGRRSGNESGAEDDEISPETLAMLQRAAGQRGLTVDALVRLAVGALAGQPDQPGA